MYPRPHAARACAQHRVRAGVGDPPLEQRPRGEVSRDLLVQRRRGVEVRERRSAPVAADGRIAEDGEERRHVGRAEGAQAQARRGDRRQVVGAGQHAARVSAGRAAGAGGRPPRP
jgi:hypothetical protein